MQIDLVLSKDHPILQEISELFEPSREEYDTVLRRGYNLAFGQLTKKMIDCFVSEIFETLMSNCTIKNDATDDVSTRKESINSLIQIIKTVGIENIDMELRSRILETFYLALNDYAIDKRGGVGSWVRQESMTALQQFIHLIATSENVETKVKIGADQPEFYVRFMCQMLQQLCEKIDSVREKAGITLQKFFKFTLPLIEVQFPHRDELTSLFIAEESKSEDDDGVAYRPWRSAHFVYQSVRPFFDSEAYSIYIFKGLITSSGGMTENSLNEKVYSLFDYLDEITKVKDADGNIDKVAGIEQKRLFLKKLLMILE